MNNNVFSAGVVPGGLKAKQDITLLICFILEILDHNFIKIVLT